jgi:alpha-galactosidase
MKKVVVIGGGSIIFSTTVMNDMLATPALSDSSFVLVNPNLPRAQRVESYVKRIVALNGLKATIRSTTDRRDALRDADFVITAIKIGGSKAFQADFEIPKKYGIDVCVGECVGPGGVFRALRTIPVMLDIVSDVQQICPKAFLLNYVNPMAMICMAIGKTSSLSFAGLCHGTQTTLDLISRYVGVKKEEIDFLAAGINHMSWFLKLEKDGKDLYPLFREHLEKPEYYVNEKVRGEVARHFGYFMTESSGHLSDYLPWFRKNPDALAQYCDQPALGGEPGFSYAIQKMMEEKFSTTDFLQYESGKLEPRSVDYCSWILEALTTRKHFRFQGNVMNRGFITNLPNDCCVEVPVFADSNGLHPSRIGDLPPALTAMNQSNITVQKLAVEAALTSDPELAVAAIAMDPLTSSVLTLKQIRDMTIELFDAEQSFLPGFGTRRPRKIHAIGIPENIKSVEVPLDPALAVANRFIKLVEAR